MSRIFFTLLYVICLGANSFAQKQETVYLNKTDSSSNYFITVIPNNKPVKAFLFLIDGFGASPKNVLANYDQIALKAAQEGIQTFLPVLKTGTFFFGTDTASQSSLKEQIEWVVKKYHLQGKDFYIGGLSIGGSCAVKYAELAVRDDYPIKPKAVFGVDPPLDWERYYNSCKRIVRLSNPGQVNGEVTYMINRLEKEMSGTPQTALENFYNNSPYSFSDTTQRAVKLLAHTPIMLITEPDVQWWLANRGYDYTDINATDHAAMINELQRLGNQHAVLVTTENKGYRQPGNERHPHSWSIADAKMVVDWLLMQ